YFATSFPLPSLCIAPPYHCFLSSSFFFTETPTTEIYTTRHTLSLHDALPIYPYPHVDEVIPLMAEGRLLPYLDVPFQDRKSTRLNSQSRLVISYAVFCLKKKTARSACRRRSRRASFARSSARGTRRPGGRSARAPSPRRDRTSRLRYLQIRRPPRATQQGPLLPYTALYR